MAISREQLAKLLGGNNRDREGKSRNYTSQVAPVQATSQVNRERSNVTLAADSRQAQTAAELANFAKSLVPVAEAYQDKKNKDNTLAGQRDYQTGAVDMLRMQEDPYYAAAVNELQITNDWRDAKDEIQTRLHERFPDLANANPNEVDAWLSGQYARFDTITPEQFELVAPELEAYRAEVQQQVYDEARATRQAEVLTEIQQNYLTELDDAATPAEFQEAFLGLHSDLRSFADWLSGAEINEEMFNYVHARGIQDGVDYWSMFPQTYADGTPSIIDGSPAMVQKIVTSRQQIANIAAAKLKETDDANEEYARLTGMQAVLQGSLGTEEGMRKAYGHIMNLSQIPGVKPSDVTALTNFVQNQLKFGEERSLDFDYSTQMRIMAHMGIMLETDEDGIPLLNEDGTPRYKDMTYIDLLNASLDPRMGRGKANRNEVSTLAETLEQTRQKVGREVAGHVSQLRRQITQRYTKVNEMGLPSDFGTPSAGIALAALESFNMSLSPEMGRGEVDKLYRDTIGKFDTEADANGISTTGAQARTTQANIEARELATELEAARKELATIQLEMAQGGFAYYDPNFTPQ